MPQSRMCDATTDARAINNVDSHVNHYDCASGPLAIDTALEMEAVHTIN
jgi:hypothetical protein